MKKIYLIIIFISLISGQLSAQDTVYQFHRPHIDSTLSTNQKYWQWVVARTMLNIINVGYAMPILKADINEDISKRRGFTVGTSLVLPLAKPKYNPNGLDTHFERPAGDDPENELLFTPALKLSFNFTKCHFDVKEPVSGVSFTQYASKIEFAPSISYAVFYAGPYFSKTLKCLYPKTQGFVHSNYLPSSDFGIKFGLKVIFIEFEYFCGLRDFEIETTSGNVNARTRMFTAKIEF